MPRLSVVIPTLNEERLVGGAIRSAFAEGASEVIVCDGGSTDRTRAVAKRAGAEVLTITPGGRARQMNLGAGATTGAVIVFLHADSRFQPGALAALGRIAGEGSAAGGGFVRRFVPSPPLLTASCHLGNLRAEGMGLYFGDQAIWCRGDVFRLLGGFPDQPLFEDFDFCRRLRQAGRLCMVRPGIITSSRRFRGGVASRLMKDVRLTLAHLMGGRAANGRAPSSG